MRGISIALQQVPHLTTLTINNSQIDYNGVRIMPNGLQHVPHLTTLNLARYDIRSLERLARRGLQHVHKLERLILSCNGITDVGAARLSNCLQHVHNLEILHLCRNEITDVGAALISNGLEHIHKLERLDLRGNQISDVGEGFISNALPPGMQRSKIDPGHCWTSEEAESEIGEDQGSVSEAYLSIAT